MPLAFVLRQQSHPFASPAACVAQGTHGAFHRWFLMRVSGGAGVPGSCTQGCIPLRQPVETAFLLLLCHGHFFSSRY